MSSTVYVFTLDLSVLEEQLVHMTSLQLWLLNDGTVYSRLIVVCRIVCHWVYLFYATPYHMLPRRKDAAPGHAERNRVIP